MPPPLSQAERPFPFSPGTGRALQGSGGQRRTVSAKIGRHFWRNPSIRLDAEDWDRLPGRFGFDPAQEAEWRDLLAEIPRHRRAPARLRPVRR